ncbi:NAD(P)/FAD-dependent oxidoreductase [Dermatobacter hominis]|uniref:NAD(P)/FAD-dependent oxidoreductase n=1 Tax=Dermatobacter hominis TaxID=2884263 RepID=UPI001D1298DD|nr:FAD-dependent oxidoreductase [Dermatobacter hominis]UDY35434.1 FAD-binding oxidoreductase [Dermatobacter hominis]
MDAVDRSLADSDLRVLWTDTADRPGPAASLDGDDRADLVVVGAGYTGLWAALRSLEAEPSRSVLVIDAGAVVGQASGRNGGFVSASLTHGLANGIARFGRDLDATLTAGRDNFAGLVSDVERLGIDARLERTGALAVATEPWCVPEVQEDAARQRAHGEDVELFDADGIRALVDSPTFLAGSWTRSGEALVDPARLGWGLADAVRAAGGRIVERTRMTGLERHGAGVVVRTDRGRIRCGAVVLGTNAARSPVRSINRRVVPVYDHVLATEPLGDRLASVGWAGRQGMSDTTNQFHYSRLTDDGRIVWGGYDAVFHDWGRIDERFEDRPETFRRLAEHFHTTFPQLEGVRFSHRWAGVIDTSTRFSVSFGTALDGRVAYAVGYTGLGVGASRFGGHVCLDLLFRPESPLLDLDLVRRAPLPFPPEPIRTVGVQLTRRAIARADAREGRRGPWLRLLDRLGLGFDS